MRTQTLLVLVLALAFGGIAAVGVVMYSGGDAGGGPPMATIVVATVDVPRGETVTAESVAARKYPKDLVPAGVLTTLDDAVGRAALAPIVKDEPVLDGKLAPKGAGRGLASLIKKGMRAITVQTPNVATGVAGFIVPGNRVDVLMTFNESGRELAGPGAITLLEDVEILAVDQSVDAPAENKMDAAQMRSVTLSVTPDQATRLTLGQNKGTIHLSLRNSTDDAHRPAKPATVTDLRGGVPWDERLKAILGEMGRASKPRPSPPPIQAQAPPSPPPAPPSRMIRTFRGTLEGAVKMAHPTAAATSR